MSGNPYKESCGRGCDCKYFCIIEGPKDGRKLLKENKVEEISTSFPAQEKREKLIEKKMVGIILKKAKLGEIEFAKAFLEKMNIDPGLKTWTLNKIKEQESYANRK